MRHFRPSAGVIHFRFIASLKLPFKFYPEDLGRSGDIVRAKGRRPAGAWGAPVGDKGELR